MNKPKFWALVPAAGSGSRLGAEMPKQYIDLVGKPVIRHTLDALRRVESLSGIVVGLAKGDQWWESVVTASNQCFDTYIGGTSRAETVLNGLQYLRYHAKSDDWIIIHDAARPCVRPADVERLIAARGNGLSGAILAVAVSDTLKLSSEKKYVEQTISRDRLWYAQTPQIFPYRVLRDALEACDLTDISDESSAMELAGYTPNLVKGRSENLKVTTREDLELAKVILGARIEREGR